MCTSNTVSKIPGILLTMRAALVIGLQITTLLLLIRFHREAVSGRDAILESEKRLAIDNRDFELRTVARWNSLADRNPNLIVPNVVEPLKGPTLTREQLERKP